MSQRGSRDTSSVHGQATEWTHAGGCGHMCKPVSVYVSCHLAGMGHSRGSIMGTQALPSFIPFHLSYAIMYFYQ